MQKFLQLTRPQTYQQRYRIANGAHVLEAPLTQAQRSALSSARNEALLQVKAPAIDATAGGRYQGFRVP